MARCNHEEARRLRSQGWSVGSIAQRQGVHYDTVVRACKGVVTKRRFCDRDEARRLKAEGWLLSDIAARQGLTHWTISRACKGVASPVRHSFGAKSQAAFNAERIRQVSQIQADRERARNWYARGYTQAAIARALDVSERTAWKYCAGLTRGPLIRGDVPDELLGRAEPTRPIEVPAWAFRAGLGVDYRDLARALGEDHAARVCRRLKAEAARPC